MGNIINFKRASKKIAKIKRQKRAKEKRVIHGQKKLTRGLIKRNNKILKTHLDDHNIENTDSTGKN